MAELPKDKAVRLFLLVAGVSKGKKANQLVEGSNVEKVKVRLSGFACDDAAAVNPKVTN